MSSDIEWGYDRPTTWITRVDPPSRPDPRVMGDSGPWPMLVPAMWSAIADPTGTRPYPGFHRAESGPSGAAGYWAPLAHLLLYSFGWRSTDGRLSDRAVMGRGLTELLDADLHRLATDTRLAFLNEVWGEDELRDFALWALSDSEPLGTSDRPGTWRTSAGAALDGGTDALHLSAHWSTPRESLIGSAVSVPAPSGWVNSQANPPSASILLDAYVGWAAALEAFGIGVDQIVAAVKSENQELPMGAIRSAEQERVVQINARLKRPEDFREIVVARKNGQPVKPAHFLKVAEAPLKDGEPIFVAGHPGNTDRLNTVAQLKAKRDHLMPLRLAELKAERDMLTSAASASAVHT